MRSLDRYSGYQLPIRLTFAVPECASAKLEVGHLVRAALLAGAAKKQGSNEEIGPPLFAVAADCVALPPSAALVAKA